jgi:hypothetical protein
MTTTPPPPRFVVESRDPVAGRRRRILFAIIGLASLAAAWIAGGYFSSPLEAQLRDRLRDVERNLAERTGQNASLEERLAIASRADQISREANLALQQTLAEQEEELAGLRANLEFYERLVGGGERQGLRVHEFRLRAIPGTGGFGFALTLTQTSRRGAEIKGRVEFAVEGIREGRVERLDWPALLQDEDADTMPFGFKYFQRIDGSFVLPEGFAPNRVLIRARGEGGEAVEQTIAWRDALGIEEKANGVGK